MRLRLPWGRSSLLAFAALALLLFGVTAAGAQSASPQSYIVQMLADPVVAYDGGVAGIAATKPGRGQKIDPSSANVRRYADHLKAEHDRALGRVGGGSKLYDYVYSYNGFAARLTESQAASLRLQKNVVAVTPDELHEVDTSDTPSFLGLDAPGGLWQQLGGTGVPSANPPTRTTGAGENIVIGIVDSGIWPESLSFTDRDSRGRLVYQQIPGWHGKCTPGENFNASMCTQKLIGAQHFNAAWGGDAGVEAQRPWEFQSPRDYNSHGTHTASTAGGNFGVQPTGDAAAFDPISGMAPRARIAAYKALWSTQNGSTASGFTSDLAAAIDQAVADGVDVINYSVGGTQTNFLDPVQVSFLFAADAGVFVSASAGNAGNFFTAAHPGPWLTTVAAGTHNRTGNGSATVLGVTYNGASLAATAVSGQLVDGENVGVTPAPNAAARQCFHASDNGGTPALDPAKVTGKIVLCDRGVNALVNKSLAVKEAGGIGMILTNVSGGATNTLALLHSVPSVHVAFTAPNYAALHAAAAPGTNTASITEGTLVFNVPAPFTASFSSRGPITAGAGDVLKPDLIAPGENIMAAVSPSTLGRDFDLFSGTSMSAPHVAGLAALLMQQHPTWSPMAVKSALMTTGSDVLDGSPNAATVIFSEGAGHVRPNVATDPGLVYEHGFLDWLAFLCGAAPGGVDSATCDALEGLGFSLDPSDLNTPSISIGALAGVQTVTRRVTNVGSTPSTYTASVSGLAGVNVAVSPSSFSIDPGQTRELEITFTRTTATLNAFTGGRLTLSDGTHSVRIPLMVVPVAIGAPLEVSGDAGGISYDVTSGFDGTLSFAARGLVAPTETEATVEQDPDQNFDPADSTGTFSRTFTVPAGQSLLRVGVDEDFITPSGTDLDVFLFRGTTFVGQAADGDSNEMVTLANPVAGDYTVFVHGFGTNGPSADFTLFEWQVPASSAGNMTVPGPTAVTTGQTVTVDLSFTGLAPDTWYLGQVVYGNPGTIGSTIVNVR